MQHQVALPDLGPVALLVGRLGADAGPRVHKCREMGRDLGVGHAVVEGCVLPPVAPVGGIRLPSSSVAVQHIGGVHERHDTQKDVHSHNAHAPHLLTHFLHAEGRRVTAWKGSENVISESSCRD